VQRTPSLTMSDDGNFVLSWDLHEQSRTSTLKALWENEDFLDVTLACDDDQIDAHKVILSAASPFFQNILKRNPHSHPLLYLRGTQKKDIMSLLDFIYSGETQVPQDNLETFMALANSLQVKGLVGEAIGRTTGLVEKDAVIGSRKSGKNPISLGNVKKEKTTARNKMPPAHSNKEIHFDGEVVELYEDMDKMESNIAGIMEKYGSYEKSEAIDSVQDHNVSNTSFTEYDEKVSELVGKSELGWICTVCPYKGKSKSHVREHVEAHIEGYSHECKYCDKTFSMKRTLRHHIRKCKASHGESL